MQKPNFMALSTCPICGETENIDWQGTEYHYDYCSQMATCGKCETTWTELRVETFGGIVMPDGETYLR